MRFWHTKLIPVLPREQLVAQWRELSSIARSIQKNGTPNHLLVNFVLNYPYNHFISYAYYVRQEMIRRGYRTMESVWKKITALTNDDYNILPINEVYYNKMDTGYLTICYYNLLEKYLCGSISNTDWMNIHNVYLNDIEYHDITF